MATTLIKNGQIVREQELEEADIFVKDNVIEQLEPNIEQAADEVIDASGQIIFPGLIDCHVHFREPGFEHKSTMVTEAAAAQSGGITAVCEMPNTNPPTTTVAAFADKVRRAKEIKDCDLHFFFGITESEHLKELTELWTNNPELKKRCCGVKLFFDHSTGNQKIAGDILDDAFKQCSELDIQITAHCEDPEINAAAAASNTNSDVSAHSDVRPPESEAKAIALGIELAKKHGTRFHVAHLSTAKGVELVGQAKAEDLPITCEVCTHHLFLTTDDYQSLGTLGKMNPPLRSASDQQALWHGIAQGTVDCIATDHAPHTLKEKGTEPALEAPSGVPGVETIVPLLLSVAAGHWPHPTSLEPEITFNYQDILRLCFINPNKIYRLGKKEIEAKATADIILVDSKADQQITNQNIKTKCAWTPFDGWELKGKITQII